MLYDVDFPQACKPMFSGNVEAQGKLLVQLMTMALHQMDDPAKFSVAMTTLAENHYARGVKAVEYGIVGETLFWALRAALGPTVYTKETHSIWVRIYSRMLSVIVPKAIEIEMLHGDLTTKVRVPHMKCFAAGDSPSSDPEKCASPLVPVAVDAKTYTMSFK